MTVASASALTQPLLDRCRERAPGYDRDNRFCQEDFDELKAAGYLQDGAAQGVRRRGPEPGAGRARNAPARAVRAGDGALHQHAQLLGRRRGRSAGAAATSRSSGSCAKPRPAKCSRPATPSTATTSPACCRRRRPSGSTAATSSPAASRSAASRRCGRGSACTAWTPAIRPRRRSSTSSCRATRRAVTIKETWDVMGMRATRSDDTVLEGAFVPDKYIARVVPAGAGGADMFVVGFFTWALVSFAQRLLRARAADARACSSSS